MKKATVDWDFGRNEDDEHSTDSFLPFNVPILGFVTIEENMWNTASTTIRRYSWCCLVSIIRTRVRRSTPRPRDHRDHDRVVKAGGPALLFERPAGLVHQHPLLINQFGSEQAPCASRWSRDARRRGREARRHPRHAAAAGAAGEGEGSGEAQVRCRLAAEDGLEGAVPGGVLRGRRRRSRTPSRQRCWPGDPAARSSRSPRCSTKDPHTGGRNAGMYRMQVIDRRSTLTGSCTRTGGPTWPRTTARSRGGRVSGSIP